MGSAESKPSDAPQNLEEVLAAYLDEVDAGHVIDERVWLDRYPALRNELLTFFADQRAVRSVARESTVGSGHSPAAPHLQVAVNTELVQALASNGEDLDAGDPPKRVGDYELICEIGRGGMGIVYEAHQPGLSRNVALKMLRRTGETQAEDLARLRNEAESIARLDHPAIVAVHDMGSSDGQFWFTMQLVGGKNLSHYASHFRDDPIAAVRIVQKIAEAVEHAHRRGILHRDLKPGNILLDEQGRPHVSDFGLARRVDYDSSLTQTGAILGTPSYLAPEQLADPRGVTTAADVYGLGAILYFLLTGRPPIVADSIFEAIDKIRNQSIAPPSRWNQLVTQDLDAVCGLCLEKHSDDRYPSADALVKDLHRLLEGKPVEARAISAWERLNRWRRLNPGLAWLSASVVTLLLLLVIGSTMAAVMLATAKIELEGEKHATLRNLYEARKQQARAARFSRRPGQRVDAITAVQEAAQLIAPLNLPESERVALRNIQIGAMQLVDLVNDQPRTTGVVSPDGQWNLRPGRDMRSMQLTNLETGLPGQQLNVQGPGKIDWRNRLMHTWFSRDGRYLAERIVHEGAGAIQVWRIDRSEPILVSDRAPTRNGARYAFSRDSKYVGFRINGRLKVRRLGDGKEVLDTNAPGHEGITFAYHSNQLAIYGDGTIRILDFLTGETVRQFDTIEEVGLAEWSPDDRFIVGRQNNNNPGQKDLHVWDSVSGAYRTISGNDSNVEFFDFHPSRAIVATTSWDGTARLWSLDDQYELLQLDGFIYHFTHGGRRLGIRTPSGSEQWRVEVPEEYRELRPPDPVAIGLAKPPVLTNEKVQGVAIHPDGRLMVGGNFNTLYAWDLTTYECIAGSAQPGADAQFSHDGRHLFTVGQEYGEVFVHTVEKTTNKLSTNYSIGKPRRLESSKFAAAPPVSQSRASIDFCTRWYTESSSETVFVYDMQYPRLIPVQIGKTDAALPAVSPDGKLLAVGYWHGLNVDLFDVATSQLLKTFKTGQAKVAFSPDGQMLAINEPGRCTVYEVETWERLYQSSPDLSHTLPRAVTFSPDSSILAFDPGSRRDIRLVATEDFRELATVRFPNRRNMVNHIDFSPDGSKLFEASGDVVQMWDLRLIRQKLGELDWSLPPIAPPLFDVSKPIRIQFESASQR